MDVEALEQRVVQSICRNGLAPANKKLIVAVSGGADSVCLLNILVKKQKELDLKLHIAHLNHQLRGTESEADADYVSSLARDLAIPATIEMGDVAAYRNKNRCSLEEAAREVRYGFLAEVARAEDTDCVAVGHTRDDQIETILMHLIRGSGTKGLCGLQYRSQLRPEENKRDINIIRPLLDVARHETTDYCNQLKLKPRADSSNDSHAFLRNRIRYELIPLLKHYNPEIDEALLRLSDIATDELSFIEDQVDHLWEDVVEDDNGAVIIDKDKIFNYSPAIQKLIFRRAIKQLIGSLKDIGSEHIEAMLNFEKKPVGKMLNLPYNLVLYNEYDRMVLTREERLLLSPATKFEGMFCLNIPGETTLPDWHVKSEVVRSRQRYKINELTASFDLDNCGAELFVRGRKPGDFFQPLGMSHLKKLQDFMVDAKIPRSRREIIPLVCSPEQIIWVVGWRIDERVKVTEDTSNILNIQFTPLTK